MKVTNKTVLLWTLIGLVVIILPIIVISLVYLFLNINIFNNPPFWYGYMTYVGSVIVAEIAMYQNQKANNLSIKFDEMNAKQNYCIARATDNCSIKLKEKIDRKIIVQSIDNIESDAIFLCEYGTEEYCQLDEYSVVLYFKDYSKSAIKSFEIIENSFICVQKQSKSGLYLEPDDESKIPIRTSFVNLHKNYCRPKWLNNDSFIIPIKIYAANNYFFYHMMRNSERTGLQFQARIKSVCDVITIMEYKYWIAKNENGFNIELSYCEVLKITA